MKRVGVDIGGTFTDCLLVWDGQQILGKALTTHHNLSVGFNEAIESACARLGEQVEHVLGEVESVRYATTLGTNALIARTGPRVGLITTAGFKSTVPISRGRGYADGLEAQAQVDMSGAHRPDPIVPIEMITDVPERIDSLGQLVRRLDEEQLRASVRTLVDRGARAIVVAFVNSVVNPEHELRAQEIILEEYPSHNLGAVPTILSHQVAGRKGEYVRTMSAILDAYLFGEMYHGLTAVQKTLSERGHGKPMLVIHNTGGTAQLSATHALQTVHSGPVAGTSASELLAREWDLGNVVATDMGGTSFDISLSVKGGIKHYDFYPVIDRWLVSVPMIHLVTLGAGGGSIARYDPVFKAIQVGPASAGSNPGPACYDAGGLDPTTTDANLILGYLDAERYASGSLKLNAKRAEQALGDLADDVSDARGTELSIIGVAHHIRTRAEQNMANGIAKELGVRGYNPREFTFVAYGGNGPMHCCGIADKLEIKKVLVPPFPSVFSALGVADMAQLHIHEKSVHISVYDSIRRTLADDFSELNATIETLEASGQQDLERQGHPADAVRHTLEIDMRYGNQLVETSVVSKQPRIRSVNEILDLIGTFGEDYEARFGKGSSAPEAGIVISGVRVKSYLESLNLELPEPEATRHPAGAPDATRTCYFNGSEEPVETSVYYAEQLDSGTVVPGPALVEAATTTYVVPPGWQQVVVGNQGAAWLERV